MKVVLIGAGNVATHLAIELTKYSFDIIQVYSRTIESASKLAKIVSAEPITETSMIANNADIYIYAVKDSVLEEIISQTPVNNGLSIHTAGSVSVDIFNKYTTNYGVLYPFQTFSINREVEWKNIPIFVEASSPANLNKLETIASILSDKVSVLNSEDRKYIHLTGVFACNFTNHMYALSEMFLKKINLPFDIALPLIDETASKVHNLSPKEAQTGPAIRFDENIINKHLSLIEDEDIKQIYRIISENIHKINNQS